MGGRDALTKSVMRFGQLVALSYFDKQKTPTKCHSNKIIMQHEEGTKALLENWWNTIFFQPRPWLSCRMLALCAVGRGSMPSRVISKTWKMVHAIFLLSIQYFGKEHGSETHSATRWPAPNYSIHCACTAVWLTGQWNGYGRRPIHQKGWGKELWLRIFECYEQAN